MLRKRNNGLWLLLGVVAATAIGLTTDEIIQSIYDSSNTALRGNVVAGHAPGGATPTPMPTATPQPTPTVVPTATPQATATPVSPGYRHTISSASGATNLTNAGASNFIGLGFGQASSGEATKQIPVAIAVTAKNLYCYWAVAPAAAKSWTATLRSGTCGTMADSTVTCTLNGNGSLQTCSDTSHTLSITANQCSTINVVSAGTPTATNVVCNLEIDP